MFPLINVSGSLSYKVIYDCLACNAVNKLVARYSVPYPIINEESHELLSQRYFSIDYLVLIAHLAPALSYSKAYSACLYSGNNNTIYIPRLVSIECPICKIINSFTYRFDAFDERNPFDNRFLIFEHFIMPHLKREIATPSE